MLFRRLFLVNPFVMALSKGVDDRENEIANHGDDKLFEDPAEDSGILEASKTNNEIMSDALVFANNNSSRNNALTPINDFKSLIVKSSI